MLVKFDWSGHNFSLISNFEKTSRVSNETVLSHWRTKLFWNALLARESYRESGLSRQSCEKRLSAKTTFKTFLRGGSASRDNTKKSQSKQATAMMKA